MASSQEPRVVVGVLGAGIAGCCCALQLLKWKLKGTPVVRVIQFEKRSELCDGLPFCHAHAGGLLYTSSQIPDVEAVALLRQSLGFIQTFPSSILWRPTVIAIRQQSPEEPSELIRRCQLARDEYSRLGSDLLGSPDCYYEPFSLEEIESMREREAHADPKTLKQWMQNFAHTDCDLSALKSPILIAREPGISSLSVAASIELAHQKLSQWWTVRLNADVKSISRSEGKWRIDYETDTGTEWTEVDFIINAAGCSSGVFDVQAEDAYPRVFELKATYFVSCPMQPMCPEMVFLGSRDYGKTAEERPNCFVQLTPYSGGVWQVHAMAGDASVFSEGVASCQSTSTLPAMTPIGAALESRSWSEAVLRSRVSACIRHAAVVCPKFTEAEPLPVRALGGYQQIPGLSPEQRVATARVDKERCYASIPIVKGVAAPLAAESLASSILSYFFPDIYCDLHAEDDVCCFTQEELVPRAKQLALRRRLPLSIASVPAYTPWASLH